MTTQTTDQIQRILDRIRRRFNALSDVIKRMDEDEARWRMDPFKPDAREGVAPEDAYTTNIERVIAEKVVYGIASSNVIVRVNQDPGSTDTQDANNEYERLNIGFLNEADRRLEAQGQPPVLDQLAWYSPNRGRYVIARALLMKNEDGETLVDILPMDPRNFVFDRDPEGITWAVYRMTRTRREIRDSYPNFRFESVGNDFEEMDDQYPELIYDYYTRSRKRKPDGTFKTIWLNGVIIDEKWAKRPTDTFAEVAPIIVRAVGSMPNMGQVFDGGGLLNHEANFGESVYAPNRGIVRALNRMRSYRMALTAYQVDRAYKAKSIGGNLTFEENPLKKGSEVTLDTTAQEEVEVIDVPGMGIDAQMLEGGITADAQAGGLSAQALSGQPPPGGLSAAAMRLLGNNLGERTRPFLKPVETCLLGCLEALSAQYETGSYRPIRVVGKTIRREAFDRQIHPESIAEHGTLTLKLMQVLPEDENVKWATAQLAITPNSFGESLADVEYAREEILGLQDAQLPSTRQTLERAKMAAPMLGLNEMYHAAVRRGEDDTAAYIAGRIQQMGIQEFLEDQSKMYAFMQAMAGPQPLQTAAAGMGGGGIPGGAPGGAPAGGPGVRPEVAAAANYTTQTGPPSPVAGEASTAPRARGSGLVLPDGRPVEEIGLTEAR
jgi:hypothetical protein